MRNNPLWGALIEGDDARREEEETEHAMKLADEEKIADINGKGELRKLGRYLRWDGLTDIEPTQLTISEAARIVYKAGQYNDVIKLPTLEDVSLSIELWDAAGAVRQSIEAAMGKAALDIADAGIDYQMVFDACNQLKRPRFSSVGISICVGPHATLPGKNFIMAYSARFLRSLYKEIACQRHITPEQKYLQAIGKVQGSIAEYLEVESKYHNAIGRLGAGMKLSSIVSGTDFNWVPSLFERIVKLLEWSVKFADINDPDEEAQTIQNFAELRASFSIQTDDEKMLSFLNIFNSFLMANAMMGRSIPWSQDEVEKIWFQIVGPFGGSLIEK